MHSYFPSRLVTSIYIPDLVGCDVSLLSVAFAAVPSGTVVARKPEQVTVTSRYITSSRSSRCCRHVTLSFSS